ncbi:MAG TPA: asparagine synthase-related protein, partial [Thermoanaerobaculia bacterium]
TDHTELYATGKEALEVVPKIPAIYDEPFSDSSQIPTYLVSAMARRHVTVCLSGDGGDELFGGYPRYFIARSMWRKISMLPRPARRAAAGVLRAIEGSFVDRWIASLPPALWRRAGIKDPSDKIGRVAQLFAASGPDAVYRHLVSHWSNASELVVGVAGTGPDVVSDPLPELEEFAARMMYRDLVTYLPDDILVKVDRASMAVSLESREPLLDHRLVELAWRLPLSMKMRDGEGKAILRSVLYRYVPREMLARPKMGFGVPLASWLRGPLRGWAEELLDERRLAREGFFHPRPLRRRWEEHLSGVRNWHYWLWDVLVFQQWLEASSQPPSFSTEPRRDSETMVVP